MDEPFLPWWLVVLLGMWATALTVWQNRFVNRELRWWAGLAAIFYVSLIILALGLSSRSAGPITSSVITNIGLLACGATSLLLAITMLGRIPPSGRTVCYVLLTVSNALFCLLVHAPEACALLLGVAAITFRGFIRQRGHLTRRTPQDIFKALFRLEEKPEHGSNGGEYWLIGAANGVLACLLIGTLAYSLRIETSRLTPTPRYSALPSRSHLQRVLSNESTSTKSSSLLEVAFGQRADLVVLGAALIFLCLAISIGDSPDQPDDRTSTPDGLPERALK